MKKIIILLCVLITSCQPESSFEDLHKHKIHLSDFRGKWVIINYWASWCAPCYKEIPALNQFYFKHKDNDAMVLGVSYDRVSKKDLKEIVAKMKIHYPVLTSDPKDQLGIENIPGLPASYIIDPKGHLVGHLFGAQTLASLEKEITHDKTMP